jgi:hypothetical protein
MPTKITFGLAVTTLVCFLSTLHARLRVQRAPGIPTLSPSEGIIHAPAHRAARRGTASEGDRDDRVVGMSTLRAWGLAAVRNGAGSALSSTAVK